MAELLDAMTGDQSLFTTADAIERLWEISALLLDNQPPIQPYAPGRWGPQPALDHPTTPCHWHLPGSRSPGGRGGSLAARGRPGAG